METTNALAGRSFGSHGFTRGAALAAAVAALSAGAGVARAADDHKVVLITPSADLKTITVLGSNLVDGDCNHFDPNNQPTVWIGNTELIVLSHTCAQGDAQETIVAELPQNLAPATYVLAVGKVSGDPHQPDQYPGGDHWHEVAIGGGGGGGGADPNAVHLTGNETIGGTKTFTSVIVGTITTAMDFLGSLAGDTTGPEHATTVVALRGVPIAATASTPAVGDVLVFNGTAWAPRLACFGIFQDCDNSPADGCESNVLTDSNNCGLCGKSCPAGSSCAGGTCAAVMVCMPITCAQQGFTCGLSGDGCGNTLNCGSCAAPQLCGGGGQPNVCGGGCVPKGCAQQGLQCGTSSDGCGNLISCGTCPAGTACAANGLCAAIGCPAGSVLCNGVCTNVAADSNNCGACNVFCKFPNAAGACIAGQCTVQQCAPGFADCDRNAADGCEINVESDATNCGTCGNVCVAGATCNNGQCSAAHTMGCTTALQCFSSAVGVPAEDACLNAGLASPSGPFVQALFNCAQALCGPLCTPGNPLFNFASCTGCSQGPCAPQYQQCLSN